MLAGTWDMVDIALVFVGFGVLIHLLLLLAAIYFIPRVLAEEEHEDPPEQPPNGHAG